MTLNNEDLNTIDKDKILVVTVDNNLSATSHVDHLYSFTTQLSMKFNQLVSFKISTIFIFCFFSSRKELSMEFILLINIKISTIFGILIFISRINFMLSSVQHDKFYELRTTYPHRPIYHGAAQIFTAKQAFKKKKQEMKITIVYFV